jgi:type III pantothenate kinase
MSWLLIDAGNTAIKWAHSDAPANRFVGTGIELRNNSHPLTQRLTHVWRLPRAQRAFGCSVADAATMQMIEQAALEAAGIGVTWFGSQVQFEGRGPGSGLRLTNGYREPEQLGADRWHAAIAGCAKFPRESLIIAAAGTATTVDCVRADAGGNATFLGGVIAPGFDLMRDALARGTARLPQAQGTVAVHPDNTDDAIASGVHAAQVGLIERIAREFAEELACAQRPAPRLLLAGGRARRVIAALSNSLALSALGAISFEDNLVLRGVALRAHAETER